MYDNIYEALFNERSRYGAPICFLLNALLIIGVGISLLDGTEIAAKHSDQIRVTEYSITIIFAIEWLAKATITKFSREYIFSVYGIIDLITWLPLLIFGDQTMVIRLLRLFRLVNLLTLKVVSDMGNQIKEISESILGIFLVIVIISLISGSIIQIVEPETFKTVSDGVWWALITASTVGYGDIYPHTGAGQAVALIVVIFGISLFATLTAAISAAIINNKHKSAECTRCHFGINNEDNYCSRCGEKTSIN